MEDNKINFSSFQVALGRESVESWGWGYASQYLFNLASIIREIYY